MKKSTNGTTSTETRKKKPSGRGGYRPGAGRPKGAKNKKTLAAEAIEQVLARGKLRNITPTEDKVVQDVLPSDKIVDIIRVCKSSNIKSLKYGNLEIEFISNPESPEATPISVQDHEPPEPMIAKVDEEVEEELRMEQLMIDDPVAFEQQIIDSHTGNYNAEAEYQ